jgi:subtilisin family serine protease
MKRLLYTTILVILMVILCVPYLVGAQGGRRFVHIILQTDGPTDTLVNHIKSLGGTIKFKYRNVPAVAASIPADLMDAVAGLPGVTKVEKDCMISLHDGPDTGNDTARFKSFKVENMEGIEVKTVEMATLNLDALPKGYANFLYTGAVEVWSETNAGAGSIVAVVDTGVVPNACIGHAVIGAPGFPYGYNATGDGILATDQRNDFHGTHMGSVIASACALSFTDPNDPLYQAISTYLPCIPDFVPIFGQAPNAKLYPVKVFDYTGADTPNSVILDGLDHILTLKKNSALDIDIVNMSLGGPTVYDGRDAFDRFVLELWKANILVVTSVGNSGPIPNTVGSPATAFNSIAVGGLDYAVSSRFYYEYIGLFLGADRIPFSGDEAAGQGLVMRPTDETRVVNFSSRGPLSDGRAGPDICALGTWSFQSRPDNSFSWELGTSASAATVSGGAALLNAYWENVNGKETNPFILRHVIMAGADKNEVGPPWQGINDQGQGALDVSTSLKLLKHGKWYFPATKYTGPLRPNILLWPRRNRVDTFKSHTITLRAGETADFVLPISHYTSRVIVDIFDIDAPDNSLYAFMPNILEINIQSAKRTATPRPIKEFFWYPWYGNSFTVTIDDGPWTSPSSDLLLSPLPDQPMEPGLMKVTLAGEISNESPVSFKIRITREDFSKPLRRPIAAKTIHMNDAFWIPVYIPKGVKTATFDLHWNMDWSRFPTSDIDMVIFSPKGKFVSFDGATLNAPERATIHSPKKGLWFVLVQGFEVYWPDIFELYLTTE